MFDFFRSLMRGLAGVIYRHPRWIVALAVLLAAVSVWLTVTKLTLVHNVNTLIRGTSEVHRYYLDYKKEFGVEEDYVIVVRSPDVEKNREVVRQIGQKLRTLEPEVRRVLDRIDFSKMERRFLLFLETKELQEIEKSLASTSSVLRQENVRFDLNSMLNQATTKFDDKYLRKGKNWDEFKPFIEQFNQLLNALADELEAPANDAKTPAPKIKASQEARGKIDDLYRLLRENEYLSYDEGRLLLITASPGEAGSGSTPYAETIAKIRAQLAEVRAQYPDVTIGLTGEPVLNNDELETSSHDSTIAGALSFILVAVLFFFSYREMARPVLALGVLSLGVAISLGYSVVTIGHLNLISQAFIAMVIGLGIDFGIQIMGRYEEELSKGTSILTSLENTLQNTGLAIITGGTTTALAFFTMCFNDFIGLAEFGVIAGGGILICLVLNLTVLPALYVWRDRSRAPEELTRQAQSSNWQAGGWLNQALLRFPAAILVGAAAITVLAVLAIPRIKFDYNLLNLQNPQLESVREELALIQSPASSVIYAVSVADSLDEARAKIAQFRALPSVAGTRSLTDLYPTDTEQKLVIIRRIVESLRGLNLKTDVRAQIDVEKSRREMTDLLAQSREGRAEAQKYIKINGRAKMAVEVFDSLIPPLERALAAMSNLTQAEIGQRLHRYQLRHIDVMRQNLEWMANLSTDRGIEAADIPEALLQRYQSPQGKILIEVLPKENVWEREPNVRFVQELRTVDPKVTGTPVQNYAYIELLRASYVQAAWLALAAIVVLILLHFRHFGYAILATLPLGLGILWTLGWMGWTGHPFNPANVITLPLVIGIGIAYGVYTIDRFREDRAVNLFNNSTGKAIILSALTTIIGFGSMMISAYRGLFSLGLIMTIGVTMCLLTCMLVLPQMLSLFLQRKK
jgi:uncharacterized protein